MIKQYSWLIFGGVFGLGALCGYLLCFAQADMRLDALAKRITAMETSLATCD